MSARPGMDFVAPLTLGDEQAHIVGDQRVVDELRNSVVSAAETRRPILVTRHYPHLSADPFGPSRMRSSLPKNSAGMWAYDIARLGDISRAAWSTITTGVHGSRVSP